MKGRHLITYMEAEAYRRLAPIALGVNKRRPEILAEYTR
jgi:hypothetical protein